MARRRHIPPAPPAGRVRCRLLQTITHAGRERAPGDFVELRPDQAARLAQTGTLETVTEEENRNG